MRRGLATAGIAAMLAALAACGDEPCNHVINDVPTFEQCQEIAVERGCSDLITYARANANRPARCKVVDCSDCNGPPPTPTVVPGR